MAEKFLFDHDFDTGASVLRKRPKAEVYEAADLEAARADARAEGERRGRELAAQEVEGFNLIRPDLNIKPLKLHLQIVQFSPFEQELKTAGPSPTSLVLHG